MRKENEIITISGESLIKDIQKEFNLFYPFLKIEFCTNAKGITSFKKCEVDPESEISKTVKNVSFPIQLNISSQRTIAEIEEDCRELLGLPVQVFRKSGNIWNAISLTDSWTLESQNQAGEFISTEMAGAILTR